MNILIVTETYLPYLTGVSISTDSIARYMVSKGHQVILLCPKPIVKGDVKPLKGLEIVYVPSLPFPLYNLNSTAIFWSALRITDNLIREKKFDVIHIQEPGILGLCALIKSKKYKIKTVGALHFIPEQIDRVLWELAKKGVTPILNILIHYVYDRFDRIFTPSNFFSKYLKSIGIKKPVSIISNGVDTKYFSPNSRNEILRKKLGFQKTDFVFMFLGRLDRDKNVETLVRAMPFVGYNVKLLVIGKGTEKSFLENLSKKNQTSKKIIWVDFIKDSEMKSYYKMVDAFSIMSPYEGQSIVTLQAVASGLPVIAANAGALPELCHDNKNGFLVDTYDFRSLAKKMNELAANKNLQKKFSVESRKISLHHHKTTTLHKLELLYKI